jgi:hypothetical protein
VFTKTFSIVIGALLSLAGVGSANEAANLVSPPLFY